MTQQVLDPHNIMQRIDAGEVQRISPSLIGTSDICLRRAGYDMDRSIPRTTGEARMVGSAYHAGLEGYYRRRMAAGDEVDYPIPVALADAEISFNAEAEQIDVWQTSKAEAWDRVVLMIKAYFEGNHYWPVGYKILGVEQMWLAPLTDKRIVKGVMDLVVEGPQGIGVVDHKTAGRKWPQGKESPRKNAQATIYSWAWWMSTGVVPAGVYFDVMTYKGVFERRMAQPSPEAMQALLDKTVSLTRIFDAIPGDQLPANPSSNLCSAMYCDHFSRCPMGSALL